MCAVGLNKVDSKALVGKFADRVQIAAINAPK